MKKEMKIILLASLLSVSVYAESDQNTTVNGTAAVPDSTRYQNGSTSATQTTQYGTGGISMSEEAKSAIARQSSSDMKLSTRVQSELKKRVPNFNPDQYVIYSQKGDVTIQGSVDTKADSDRIEKFTRRIPGVKRVQNQLVIENATDSSGSKY